MTETPVPDVDPYERKRIGVLDTEMTYLDPGEGNRFVVLHGGNPTSCTCGST